MNCQTQYNKDARFEELLMDRALGYLQQAPVVKPVPFSEGSVSEPVAAAKAYSLRADSPPGTR